MNRPWLLGALLLCVFLAFVSFRLRERHAPAENRSAPEAPASATAESTPGPSAIMEREISLGKAQTAESLGNGKVLLPGVRELFADFQNPDEPAERDIEQIDESIAQYRRVFGSNPPGGLNQEITAALLGENPKNLAVLPRERLSMSSDGEILDRWGTAYFFHPVSASKLEVLSAGPDRTLWTADDVGTFRPDSPQELPSAGD
jgi:hypothetical protein